VGCTATNSSLTAAVHISIPDTMLDSVINVPGPLVFAKEAATHPERRPIQRDYEVMSDGALRYL
jgi:hypothetical protein